MNVYQYTMLCRIANKCSTSYPHRVDNLCYNRVQFSLKPKELALPRWASFLVIFSLLMCLGSCSVESATTPAATAAATTGGDVGSAATAVVNDGWERVEEALEYRELQLSADGQGANARIIRLDPTRFRIRVAYDRLNPGTIAEWVAAVKPVALINGGFFDENDRATALVIFDGVAQGTSYDGFGGMVVVNAAGEFELRSLRQQPYDPVEALQQAMQSAPMLIQPGGTLSELQADTDRSRRTVIARDTDGRILLIITNAPTLSLTALGRALQAAPLNLDAALNLDGGRSTGMFLDRSGRPVQVEAFDRLPLVLVVDHVAK